MLYAFQWALGVLFWEVYTYGALPYANKSTDEIEEHVVENEKILPLPRTLKKYAPSLSVSILDAIVYDIIYEINLQGKEK